MDFLIASLFKNQCAQTLAAMSVRASQETELQEILEVHRSAFGDEESPSIISLVSGFLKNESPENLLSLVYKSNNKIVGHVIFSKVKLESSDSLGYILAPLGVASQSQKQGVGSALINNGLGILESQGANFALVYGDPGYYSRFSFSVELGESFIPPFTLAYPHGWHALSLGRSPLSSPQKFTCLKPLMEASLW